MTRDTIFRLYSQSKPVTAAAVMILFEEGKFLLTDPVAKYLPELADMKVYVGEENGQIKTEPARPITIQHLLTHTAGFTYDFFQTPVAKMYAPAGTVGAAPQSRLGSLEEWTKELAKLPLIAQPGSDWNYSVSHRRPRPAGRGDVGDELPRLPARPDLRAAGDEGHRLLRARRQAGPLRRQLLTDAGRQAQAGGRLRRRARIASCPKIEMGGSGLVGTAGDYFRFAQMLANGGELDGVRILAPSTVGLMMSDHLNPEMRPDPLSSLFAAGMFGRGGRTWGLGFGLGGFVATDPALVRHPDVGRHL